MLGPHYHRLDAAGAKNPARMARAHRAVWPRPRLHGENGGDWPLLGAPVHHLQHDLINVYYIILYIPFVSLTPYAMFDIYNFVHG